MKQVEVTLEVTCTKAFSLEVSDADYEALAEGDPTILEERGLIRETRAEGTESYDWTVYDPEQDRMIQDWR